MSPLATLLKSIEDYDDFNSAPIIEEPCPEAIEFCKHVNKGYPRLYAAYRPQLTGEDCLNGLGQYARMPPCSALDFTPHDLISLVTETIEVAVTPNGRADALHNVEVGGKPETVFLQPANLQMTMSSFLSEVSRPPPSSNLSPEAESTPVYYLQSQNSNLTSHSSLSPLLSSIPGNFPFAAPVLGEPEALNIWIGDERSVTSAHRDPYENLYLVLKGQKTFTLWPPVQEILMDAQMVRTGRYVTSDQHDETNHSWTDEVLEFDFVIDEAEVDSEDGQAPRIPWVSVDSDLPRLELQKHHPLYAKHATPRTVTVKAGQILYLPSGWYHQVRQECGKWKDGTTAPCIAVNYWYDMDYEGEKYVMRQILGTLVEQAQEEIRQQMDTSEERAESESKNGNDINHEKREVVIR